MLHSPLPARVRAGVRDAANAAGIIHVDRGGDGGRRARRSLRHRDQPHRQARASRSADFPFPGHTEFLAALAERHFAGKHYRPVMMLASHELRVVPLTVHCALAEVPKAITRALIFETARITYAALKRDFGIASPRIAVAGLNPHAGEEGTMGREEIESSRRRSPTCAPRGCR